MANLELINLKKSFNGQVAVLDTNLKISSGEFFSFLGPSGCGKTTTLRMIAGFVRPDSGEILINDENIINHPPEKRQLGIVFQNYAIFPHMTVGQNIAFGLKLRNLDPVNIERQVGDALRQVGLLGYENRYQRELSGGEQQRVALARVLVIKPRILLLDEPLSALDKNLREEMKYWIKDLQRSLGITTIYVTHDQGEALTMSDRIGVMNKARVEQVGTPVDIYERPANLFVTSFIGHSNLIEGKIVECGNGRAKLDIGEGNIVEGSTRVKLTIGDKAKLILRPENIIVNEKNSLGSSKKIATIISKNYLGSLIRYQIQFANNVIVAEVLNQGSSIQHEPNSFVEISWQENNTEILPIEN
mgnify:CR=1 FL=1